MPHNLYRVVFIGDLVAGDARDVVKRNLANLFGTTAGSLDRLFGSRSIVLKKNVDRETAIRFRDAIIRSGAFCRIETMDSASEVLVTLPEDIPDRTMTCPRCNTEQVKSALCRSCGVIAEEYKNHTTKDQATEIKKDDTSRRYYDRRRDLETSLNVTDEDELRLGLDRRRAHLDWHI